MGAYENPQIGMIDYTLGQKAFDNAFNTMYTVFNNYYSNIADEKKAIKKKINNAWDMSKAVVDNSADAGDVATQAIFAGGTDAQNWLYKSGNIEYSKLAARQFNAGVEVVGNMFNRVYIEQESDLEFDQSDIEFEKYSFIHKIMTNNNQDGRSITFDFKPLPEGANPSSHKWFDKYITLQNADGTVVNNERFQIKDGKVSLDDLNRMYSIMDTNKVNHKAYSDQFNNSLVVASGDIKSKIARDVKEGKTNTLSGYLNQKTNELLSTPSSIDKYYANIMDVNDRITGGLPYGLLGGKELITKSAKISANGKDYDLPREFFRGAITKEKIIAMFDDVNLGGFDSTDEDGISLEENNMIDAALEYRNNVARAHLWRRLSIGQVDSYVLDEVVDTDKPASWQNKIFNARQLTKINEKKLADKLMGKNNDPIFIGSDPYKWGGHVITNEIYDPVSGTIDFVLKMSQSTTKKTADEAWAALSDEEKAIYTDKQQFEDNYKGGVNYKVITSTLSRELGRKYKLWDESDVNELLKILATRDDSFSTIKTDIEMMGNYPAMVAGTIYSEIMSNAEFFSDKTGMPTDKGWKEIEKILPKGFVGIGDNKSWYSRGEAGLSITEKNQILKLIKQMGKK